MLHRRGSTISNQSRLMKLIICGCRSAGQLSKEKINKRVGSVDCEVKLMAPCTQHMDALCFLSVHMVTERSLQMLKWN